MNHTTDNTTFVSCGFEFLPINPANISSDLRAALNVRFTVNVLICPLIILLNILVMVAVKTKRQLRTKSNIALACLATTDLVVGLVVQALQIGWYIFLFHGEASVYCSLTEIGAGITFKCLMASLYHLLLMSAERYLAIKHPFAYETQVTEVRIIIASAVAWAAAIFLPTQDLWLTSSQFLIILTASIILFFYCLPMIYFNIAVYKEVRRNEKQIAANQVSLVAKEKLVKNKKAFYTTIIVLLAVFLCYIPVNISVAILAFLKVKFLQTQGVLQCILSLYCQY